MGFMPQQTISINSGQVASAAWHQTMRWASLGIMAPMSLTEYAVLEVAEVASGGSTSGWRTLQRAGADVTLVVGKAIEIPVPPFPAYRITVASATAAQRDFYVFPRR